MLLCLTEQVPCLFVNLVPPMDVSLLYKLHGGSSKSCEIMGWWVKYKMFRLTLLWHRVIQSCNLTISATKAACVIFIHYLAGFRSFWSGKKVVEWFQWFELHTFFKPEADIVAIVRNLNLGLLKPLACDISDLRLGYRYIMFSQVVQSVWYISCEL